VVQLYRALGTDVNEPEKDEEMIDETIGKTTNNLSRAVRVASWSVISFISYFELALLTKKVLHTTSI
jgi:hypothetical protein